METRCANVTRCNIARYQGGRGQSPPNPDWFSTNRLSLLIPFRNFKFSLSLSFYFSSSKKKVDSFERLINETRNRGRNYFEDIWKSAGTSSITRGSKKKRRYRGRGDYPDGAKKWLKRRGLRRVCVANRRGPSRATLPPSSTSRADLLATYTPNLTCNGSSKTAESDRQTEGEEERAREWKGSARWSERGKQGVGVGSVRDPTTCGSSR